MTEIDNKIALLREMARQHGFAGIRLRGIDWFSWATAGVSNVVLLASETGIAEVFITARDAYLLTDSIEVERLRQEAQPPQYLLWSAPWFDAQAREAFVHDHCRGGLIASDRPRGAEHRLPPSLVLQRWLLGPEERERYRSLGREAAEAMTETLQEARPEWTEFDLAAAGARALWRRGIDPALSMAAGSRRLAIFRHPMPTAEKIGERAMLVFCGRRHGLYANLTRFVYFRAPTELEQQQKVDVAQVEAAVWAQSQPGVTLAQLYETLVRAYRKQGYPGEQQNHHQGGPTGYLAREALAGPEQSSVLAQHTALAWNPSLPGSKIEDTVITTATGRVEILTVDRHWPTFNCEAQARPDFLVKQ